MTTPRSNEERLRRLLSHDLRAPLAVVVAQCDMLSAEVHGPLLTRQAEAVASIVGQSERLLALIEEARLLLSDQPEPS